MAVQGVRSSRTFLGGFIAAAIGLAALIADPGVAAAAQSPVGLGTASSYAVLAGFAVTNTGPSVINGDLGVSPKTAITGFPPGLVNGTVHSADAEALQAKADLTLAYEDAAGRGPAAAVATELGGLTLEPGVYSGATLEITGTLTLDAKGDPNAVFLFKSASTLVTASNSNVLLINSANPCNVYWQVSSSATLGTGTAFVGTTLALSSITANTGATVQGRLLARNGAVTLDTNVITRPDCAVIPPTPTTTTTVPITTTTVPITTTTVPITTTTAPTTSTPATTTSTPATTTSVPATTTSTPVTTTSTPATTTSTPVTTPPATVTTVPGSETTVPGIGTPGGGTPSTTPGSGIGSTTPGATTPPGTTSDRPPSTTTTLARTGSNTGPMTGIGLVLITLGIGALVMSRRQAITRR